MPKITRISQTDIPRHEITDALRVGRALIDNFAGDPTSPFNVASALGLSPSGTQFKMLTGASIAYGITDGGYNAAQISLTDLGKRILKPLAEGDSEAGLIEALLQPRIPREFLTKYNTSPIPKVEIARNVLEDMGVPADRSEEVFQQIVQSARDLNLVKKINAKEYIHLDGGSISASSPGDAEPSASIEEPVGHISALPIAHPAGDPEANEFLPPAKQKQGENKRVFITHGKNTGFVDPIRQLLEFGDYDAVVSVEKQTVSQPVPDKVMADMRSCMAAIIHVVGEEELLSKEGDTRVVLNPNVLIEIGAAMALYDKRFILLVQEGTKLPSNLQGLYEVRYSGDTLDSDATIRLLKAINQIKAAK